MTIGSLFSGIGGLEMGLEMCGLGPVIWQCDSDPYARAVLEAHWPGVKRYEDVRSIDAKTERPDIICGGFPCQPVSVAGKRKAQRDPRWLWPHFAAALAVVRPAIVFIENVPGLRGAGLREVLADLASLGFDAEWATFSACETGAPHTRTRLFILANANGQSGQAGLRPWTRETGSQPLPTRDDREMPAAVRVVSDADAQRVADGAPREAHRLRLLGNACVPAQAALAWRTLTARLSPSPSTPTPPPPGSTEK